MTTKTTTHKYKNNIASNIIMEYYCECCEYRTSDKGNYSRHKKTKKHITKSNKLDNSKLSRSLNDPQKSPISTLNKKTYNCEFCNIEIARSCHLSRHYKICSFRKSSIKLNELSHKNKNIKNDSKIKLLEEKLKNFEKENNMIKIESEKRIKLLEKQNNILEKENEYHKQLIISAGNMIQSSMSTLNHLIQNYNNAPILEPLKDYSFLEEKDKFINNLAYYYNENKLDQYIGNFLVKQYKTSDPTKRANWNSDTSRLTYINREMVDNKPNWVIDKKGVKMTNIIIDPFLGYIKNLAQEEIKKITNRLDDEDDSGLRERMVQQLTSLGKIVMDINSSVLSKDINRYLAPHLYFNKNNVLIFK